MNAIPSLCPKCGSPDFRVAHPHKSHINPLVLIFGGLPLSLLWSGSRKQEMRCSQCDTVFKQSTTTSRILSVILLGIILLMMLGGALAVFVEWKE